MTYDTSTFSAFIHSLGLQPNQVNARAGRMVAGPPAPLFELALRLGLGGLIIDTPANRTLFTSLGLPEHIGAEIGRRLRSRSQWRQSWESLATPYLKAVDEAMTAGDRERAAHEAQEALRYIGLAGLGDGYYIHIPTAERLPLMQASARLYNLLNELANEPVERLTIEHSQGTTTGLLHFPKSTLVGATLVVAPTKFPTLLCLPPTNGYKENYDFVVRLFREAGFATCCIDLPAHGENFNGPRLQPDSEVAAVAALERLAQHPKVDSDRLAVMGGSLGAFFAQRTAAASPLAKACLAFASPFDIGHGLRDVVPGIQDSIRYLIGAPDLPTAYEVARPFHLRETVERIQCPLALVHGTLDHICDFTAPFEIARRVRAPFEIFPILGADHEVSQPASARFADLGIQWLKRVLKSH